MSRLGAKHWVGTGTLALRPLPERILVLRWLVSTPGVPYSLYR